MDLKMAQYMKVPPRTVFWGQLAATLWSCFVQIAVLFWAFANIDGICDKDQPNKFSCPNGRVFFNASIIWGVIGPQRVRDEPRINEDVADIRFLSDVCCWEYIRWPSVVLAIRSFTSCTLLRPRTQMAKVFLPPAQCSSYPRRYRKHPSVSILSLALTHIY